MAPSNITRWVDLRNTGLRSGRRTRRRPMGAFVQIVPWLTLLVVLALFFSVWHRVAVVPGIHFSLPAGAFVEGSAGSANLVLLRAAHPAPATLAFFNDVRFSLTNGTDAARLQKDISASLDRGQGGTLLLLADREVPHGDVMAAVGIARMAGVREVNVAVKPD